MDNGAYMRAKLLVCLTGDGCGEALVRAARSAGGRGGTAVRGRALSGTEALPGKAPDRAVREVVFIVMTGEAPAVKAAVLSETRKSPGKPWGAALVLEVPDLFVRFAVPKAADSITEGSAATMEPEHKLIAAIVNHGFAGEVMAAARAAGARGGTLLKANGTGTDMDVQFFGVPLVPEKEMLLVVAERGRVEAILGAMRSVPVFAAPGGGILFTLGVDEFIALGGSGNGGLSQTVTK